MQPQSIRDRLFAALASVALSLAMIAVTVAPTADAAIGGAVDTGMIA